MRVLVVAAFSVLLAGCFEADRPLFDEARGDCPFKTATSFISVDPSDRTRAETGEAPLVFETDGAYCKVTGQGGEPDRVLFVPIGNDWYILQDETDGQTYSMMRVTRRGMKNYLPNCRDFSAARLTRAGISFDEERDRCKASAPEQIETLFREWRGPFRRPSSEMRRVE